MEKALDNSNIGCEKSQEQRGGHKKNIGKPKQSSLCFIDDLFQLNNPESESKLHQYKGRVVLRGDIVKDDSGAHAVFTEQGSSPSQMTAAKVMDVIARPPDCMLKSYLKIPKSECPGVWIRLPRHK